MAKDTAIYGLSSIIGRFLNYLLVPLYTAKISAASGGYGVITNVYAYVALLLVILTYGMETTFFRFANKEDENPQRVYSTTLMSVGFTSLLFVVLVLVFIGPISRFMGYEDHPSYIWMMAITVALDAFQCIPFAYLRYKKKPLKFAALKLLFIGMNIVLNLLAFLVLPLITGKPTGVGYVFGINLLCTASITFLFYRELTGFKYVFDRQLLSRMWTYSWPILVLGIAGILNQTADKILFPKIYDNADAHAQLGIYGAASKIAMIMAMITQAFRYAYEPFVFGGQRSRDSKENQAVVMKYFVIFALLAYLTVMAYLDVFKYFIAPSYWEGLRVVPIVMMAEVFMSVYFNLSFWYKLNEQTWWGAVFSAIGCAVLLAINIVFVPRYGYMACAWGGLAGYGVCMVLSYAVGRRKNPVPYKLLPLAGYFVLALGLYGLTVWLRPESTGWRLVLNTAAVCVYVAVVLYNERNMVKGLLQSVKLKMK